MIRAVEHEEVVDTSTFSSVQLQPHYVATLTWNALARWMRTHFVSFPELIGKERTGLVVLGFHLEYGEPLSFFDCDCVRVRTIFRAASGGARAVLDVRIVGAGRKAAMARLILCPVAIDDPVSLAAHPAPLPEHLLARLQPEEVDAAGPVRLLPERRAALEIGSLPLGDNELPFMVNRHRCEVAEQWAWTSVPAIVEEARERLALDGDASRMPLRATLGQPLRQLDIEFGKPFFSFDHGRVISRAFMSRGRVGIVHRLTSTDRATLHATVVEAF